MLEVTVADFLDRLASKEPTPGGGSVAALCGALAAALGAMVCNLTIGKPRYAEVEAELQAALEQLEKLREQLTALMAADVAAYEQLSAAYKLPKDSDAEKAARSAAIQESLTDATGVPLRIAESAAAVLDIVPVVIEKGSTVAVSDAGMAALLAETALKSAALNVWINLSSDKDEGRANANRERLEAALASRGEHADGLYEQVVKAIRG